MRPSSSTHWPVLAVLAAVAGGCADVPLRIVHIPDPRIDCAFHPECTPRATDVAAPMWTRGVLSSRFFEAAPAAPAVGRWAYEYRINLTDELGIGYVPIAFTLSVDIGPVDATLDLDGDGAPGEQVYVRTDGPGSVVPDRAIQNGDRITFYFDRGGVQASGRPGQGQSTFYFGVVSRGAPRPVRAVVTANMPPSMDLDSQAPAH